MTTVTADIHGPGALYRYRSRVSMVIQDPRMVAGIHGTVTMETGHPRIVTKALGVLQTTGRGQSHLHPVTVRFVRLALMCMLIRDISMIIDWHQLNLVYMFVRRNVDSNIIEMENSSM